MATLHDVIECMQARQKHRAFGIRCELPMRPKTWVRDSYTISASQSRRKPVVLPPTPRRRAPTAVATTGVAHPPARAHVAGTGRKSFRKRPWGELLAESADRASQDLAQSSRHHVLRASSIIARPPSGRPAPGRHSAFLSSTARKSSVAPDPHAAPAAPPVGVYDPDRGLRATMRSSSVPRIRAPTSRERSTPAAQLANDTRIPHAVSSDA